MKEQPTEEFCRRAWYDGKQSHVCYQDKGHQPPCKCRSCGHIEGERPRVAGWQGGSPSE